jgi:Dynamin family
VETSLFNEIRRDALQLLDDACDQAKRRDLRKQIDEIGESKKQLLSGRLTTAACGEFKRGKSTLLGALVEQPALCPPNVDISTSVVSTLEYGPEEQITAFIGDRGDAAPVQISRQQIAEYVTEQGNPGNDQKVQLLRIQSPIPLLKTGLVLLDTPGAGGLNTDHTAVTYGILGSVDVAIFVIDALTPLTVDELSLLHTVDRQAARLLLAVTKIDRVAGYETAVSNARLKLDELLGPDRSAMIPIIPVSSTAKLDWVRTKDEESLEVSNFPALETALWEMLTEQGGAILISRAMSQLVRTLDDVRTPLDVELVALTGDQGDVASTAASLQVQHDHLAELAGPGAGWRRVLLDAFNEIRNDAEDRLIRELTAVEEEVDGTLAEPHALDRAQELLADLERDVSVLWSGLVRDLRVSVADLSDRVEGVTGVRPNPVLAHGGVLTAFETFGRVDRPAHGEPGAGFMALGWLGEVLSYVMGNVVVYAISQVATSLGVGTARAKRQQQEFAEDVRDQLRRADRELRADLTELLDSSETSLMRSFDTVIEADRDRLIAADRAMRAEPGSATRERVDKLNTELRLLTDLRARATSIVDRVTAPDGRLPVG